MPRNWAAFAFLTLLIVTSARGEINSTRMLSYDVKDYDTFLTLSPTLVSISSPLDTVTGYGLRLGWNRNLTNRWNFEGSFSQTFGTSEAGAGFGALCSSLEAFAQYAISGQFESNERTVLFDNKPFINERRYRQRVFSVGFGLMQLLLNGSTDVYPATGLGFSLSYDITLWNRLVRPSFRYGLLSGNSQDINLMALDLAIMFDF